MASEQDPNPVLATTQPWFARLGNYVAALILAFVLYPPNAHSQKNLYWAAVGVGVVVVILAIWLLILALDTGSANLMGMGSVRATVGIGAILNVVAGSVVAAGGFLKARHEKLI